MDRISIGYPAGYLRFFRIRIGFGYPFLKKIGSGSGYWFDLYNEIFLKVIQNVTNNRCSVFFAIFFIFIVSMCCTHNNQWEFVLLHR